MNSFFSEIAVSKSLAVTRLVASSAQSTEFILEDGIRQKISLM